jgi:hypothetical protein
VFGNFAQLRSTDARISLARGATNNDVERPCRTAQPEFIGELLGLHRCHIPRLCVVVNCFFCAALEEVDGVRSSSQFVGFHGGHDLAACRLESEAQTPTSGE